MIKKQMEQYIANNIQNNKIELFEIEKDYAEKHHLLADDIQVTTRDFHFRLIERCNKETEDLIRAETTNFLDQPVSLVKKHREEFIYVEASALELIRIDAIVLEFDDVFETYTALFGLQLQKKYGPEIKTYLETNLKGNGVKYSVMFSDIDGLWEVNFTLDYLDGFSEDVTLKEVCHMIYQFVFKLVEVAE